MFLLLFDELFQIVINIQILISPDEKTGSSRIPIQNIFD